MVLVKALPQPSKRYGETVCCAGITSEGNWKRLYPIRFRHLSGSAAFSRWDWVSFQFGTPRSDPRVESCHVHEETIVKDGRMAEGERARVLNPLLDPSAKHAFEAGRSLALVRPRKSQFYYRPRTAKEILAQRDAFRRAAMQKDIFDKELSEIDPSPYDFRFRFSDASGDHDHACGDWETHAMFWNWRQSMSDAEVLGKMVHTFNEQYPKRGMVFALGNMAKRPQTWQMLGVIRLNEIEQESLFGRI